MYKITPLLLLLLLGGPAAAEETLKKEDAVPVIIDKSRYLEIGQVVQVPEAGRRQLSIDGQTRFRVRVRADKQISSPYTQTPCVYYAAVAEDETDPAVSVFVERLDSRDQQLQVVLGKYRIVPDQIKLTEIYETGPHLYSLTPIVSAEGKIARREYCLRSDHDYELEIFVFGSALPPDDETGKPAFVTSYHFYFTDRSYRFRDPKSDDD